MAKKSARKTSAKTSGGRNFSMVGLHNKLDETLARLKREKKTKKRDQLIGLVLALKIGTPCPQQMLINLGI